MIRANPEIPPQLLGDNANSLGELKVLLSYQQELCQAVSKYPFVVCEKSRRIGMTWAIGAQAVLTSALNRSDGGMDTLYIGYNLDMAREFIDVCGMWARAFNHAVSGVEEFIFKDRHKDGDRDIKAFRISFDSGFEIIALTSNPRSLRGRQGFVIFDEAAFHDDLSGMLKAAMALLMWGGRVLVISTHDGEDNPFNQLIQDIRSGRRTEGFVYRCTFDDAIAQGLYERICLVKEETPTAKGKKEYIDRIRAFYDTDADEELDCIPSMGSGSYLTLDVIDKCSNPNFPVIRYEQPDSFKMVAPHLREAEVNDFCERTLLPLLSALDKSCPHALGEDFGRVSDLSIFAPVQVCQNANRHVPFLLELRNIPFEQQRQILFYIIDRLPRFFKGALDAGGNGQYLAEVAAQRYGENLIEEVHFTPNWYRENMPPFKAAFEDQTFLIPKDRDVISDLRLIRMVKGIAKVPDVRTADSQDKNKKRHGDAAIALALGHWASRQDDISYGYIPVIRETHDPDEKRLSMRADTSEDDRLKSSGWNKGTF